MNTTSSTIALDLSSSDGARVRLATDHDRTCRDPFETRPRTVFLAEDDRDLRCQLIDLLREAGFEVRAASTGDAMLTLLTAASRAALAPPDVVVMDVRMPRHSGMELLRALREAEWHQPVVLMTGFADHALREAAVASGAAVVLDKPFDAEDLVRIVDLLAARTGGSIPEPQEWIGNHEEALPPTLRSIPAPAPAEDTGRGGVKSNSHLDPSQNTTLAK